MSQKRSYGARSGATGGVGLHSAVHNTTGRGCEKPQVGLRQLPNHTEDGLFTRLNVDLRLELLRDGKLTDESRRRIERELDLEEESAACRKEGEAPL